MNTMILYSKKDKRQIIKMEKVELILEKGLISNYIKRLKN